jgi:hypothetical protein
MPDPLLKRVLIIDRFSTHHWSRAAMPAMRLSDVKLRGPSKSLPIGSAPPPVLAEIAIAAQWSGGNTGQAIRAAVANCAGVMP